VAGLWEKEGAGLRVLKNGDGEGRERARGRTEGWERRRSGKKSLGDLSGWFLGRVGGEVRDRFRFRFFFCYPLFS